MIAATAEATSAAITECDRAVHVWLLPSTWEYQVVDRLCGGNAIWRVPPNDDTSTKIVGTTRIATRMTVIERRRGMVASPVICRAAQS